MSKISQAFIFTLMMGHLLALQTLAQRQVGIPFEAKDAYILELDVANGTMMVDLGDNDVTALEKVTVSFGEQTEFVAKKDDPFSPDLLRPGLQIALNGEKLASSFVAHRVEVKVDPRNWKVSIEEGVFEKLEDEVAFIDGHRVILAAGVKVQGDNEWSKMKFASFDEMMLGSIVEIEEAYVQEDGTLIAQKAKTWPNLYSDADDEVLNAVKAGVKYADPANLSGGRIEYGDQVFKLVEDLNVQAYVTRVGYKVIPGYIKDMPEEDPSKVSYRFYVIQDPTLNAFAYPDGAVFINTGLLEVLENEAQLAAILGHEIAHVTHEHSRKRYETEKKKKTGRRALNLMKRTVLRNNRMVNATQNLLEFGAGVLSSSYHRSHEDQADRVGMFYMQEAGYDPREAPQVWRNLVEITGQPNFTENLKRTVTDWLAQDAGSTLTERVAGLAEKRITSALYASHPSANARLRNLNRQIAQSYHEQDFSQLEVGKKGYQQVFGQR